MLTVEIGNNAGKIWNLLNEDGAQPVKSAIKKLKLSASEFYMAAGWLSREGKIYHFEEDGVLMMHLKE